MKMFEKLLINIGSKIILIHRRLLMRNNSNEMEESYKKEALNEILEKQEKKDGIKIPKYYVIAFLIIILIGLKVSFIIIPLSFIVVILIKLKPQIEKNNKNKEILKSIPYALRQMSIELKAGIGLFDSMQNIAESNYEGLSSEFKITLEEIRYGSNYTEALSNLAKRVDLEIMTKLTNQIIRTLNNGGNLADTLDKLADENTKNIHIKYKEYSEKLNSIMLIYMFIGVLLPVIMFIMIIAATTVMGPIIKPELLMILYIFLFPLIISFIIFFIKRMEPTI